MAAGRRLVYSGRVDNRDELIARYGASVAATDGALLAAAIERDGPDGLRHVVGDFALACWDADGVLLARDAMGHELGFVIEVVSQQSQEMASAVLAVARANMLHTDFPGRLCREGNMAFPFSPSDISVGPTYKFSVFHVVRTDDPYGMFPIEFEEVH